MDKKLKIAVVYNEPDPSIYLNKKPEVSKKLDFELYFDLEDLSPLEEYDEMVKILNNSGFDAYQLNIWDNIEVLINDIKNNKPDIIFNFIEIYLEDSRLEMSAAGILELFKTEYTGATPVTLANCQNKLLTKRLLRSEGILTSPFQYFEKGDFVLNEPLNFPLIVKPAFEDASIGIEENAIVNNSEELSERLNYVYSAYNQSAIVEEFIQGRELNASVLGYEDPFVLPISEIDFSNMPKHLHHIVSYQAKWVQDDEAYHKTIPICPSILEPEIEKHVKEIALKAFKIMECRDYARVDMRLTKDNKLYVLEVNPNPDISEGVGLMRSAEAAGFSYQETLLKIISFAIQRYNKKKKTK